MDEENVELHLPPRKWFTIAAIVVSTLPWLLDLSVAVLQFISSVLLFVFVRNEYTILHFMTRNVNYRVKLRRYNLLDDDDG